MRLREDQRTEEGTTAGVGQRESGREGNRGFQGAAEMDYWGSGWYCYCSSGQSPYAVGLLDSTCWGGVAVRNGQIKKENERRGRSSTAAETARVEVRGIG